MRLLLLFSLAAVGWMTLTPRRHEFYHPRILHRSYHSLAVH